MSDDKQKRDSLQTIGKNKPTENKEADPKKVLVPEVGGRGGLDPSRFGDWEIAGKCVDF